MELLLMQHGVSLSKEINPEQPLSPVGRDQAGRTAMLLQSLGLRFTAIVTSPKARAMETAIIMAEAVGYPAKALAISDAFTPKAAPQTSVEALRPFEGDTRVLVVGHLPNLPALASHLLTTGPALGIVFENSGLTCLDVGAAPARSAALLYHLPPRLIQRMVDG